MELPSVDVVIEGLATNLFVGTEENPGNIVAIGPSGSAAVQLQSVSPSNTALIRAGTGSTAGELVLRDEHDRQVLHADARTGVVSLGIDGQPDDAADDLSGGLRVRGRMGRENINIDGATAQITVGSDGQGGNLLIIDKTSNDSFRVDGESSTAHLGGPRQSGDLRIVGLEGLDAIRLDGANAYVTIGGFENEGDLLVTDKNGFESFRVNGESGSVHVGAGNIDGTLTVHDLQGHDVIDLRGSDGRLSIGTSGKQGYLRVRDSYGRTAFAVDGDTADVRIGSDGVRGNLVVRDEGGADRIRLRGDTGDIELMGADLAEEFASGAPLDAGTVVVAVGPDEVAAASEEADRRVVGVVSGAGDFRSALRLASRPGEARTPVALVGRVHCKAEAEAEPITFGDLLITSAVEGHVRAAPADPRPGTVVGKALGELTEGRGLIPVLLMQR